MQTINASQSSNHPDLSRLILGCAEMDDVADVRQEPARVYPRHDAGEQWVVEPPPGPHHRSHPVTTFTGSAAMVVALTFAFEQYGSVVHLSR